MRTGLKGISVDQYKNFVFTYNLQCKTTLKPVVALIFPGSRKPPAKLIYRSGGSVQRSVENQSNSHFPQKNTNGRNCSICNAYIMVPSLLLLHYNFDLMIGYFTETSVMCSII